jgi:hypothetical protein
MGFLDANGGSGIFVEVPDMQHKKLLRPLADKPTAIWGHGIPSPETYITLSTGKTLPARLRDYHFEICTATNRRGQGCRVCNRQDAAWNFLSQRDQTNRKGQRVDFPKKCVYIIPVWDYEEQEVKILAGGNQLFEEMAKYSDQEGKDVRACDWYVWKGGQGKTTKYESSRQDATTFSETVSAERIAEAVKEAVLDRYTPLSDEELNRKLLPMTVEAARAQLEAGEGKGAAPTAPGLPSGVVPQLIAPTDDPKLVAARALFPGKTDDEIKAILAGAANGNFQ